MTPLQEEFPPAKVIEKRDFNSEVSFFTFLLENLKDYYF